MALSKLEELPQSDVMKEWRERRFKATRKNVVLDAERKNLFTYMDEKNIWYMPLKGAVLKDLYPKHDMRQMADNDILFDVTCQKEIRDYFVSHGYEVISYAKGNHDVYEKPPVYNFEMHTALFGARMLLGILMEAAPASVLCKTLLLSAVIESTSSG